MSYVKFCPRCQTTTAVDAAICPHCGHRYRTHFQPPVSEKTIAMTSATTTAGEDDEDSRLSFRPRLVLLCVAVLAILGLVYGTVLRRAHTPTTGKSLPTASRAFTPYDVTLQGIDGAMVPFATQSGTDLQLWDASAAHASASAGGAETGDDPAHVHLYLSKRIVLIASGTPARVLLEQSQWRRVQILSGPSLGKTGFVRPDRVKQTAKPE